MSDLDTVADAIKDLGYGIRGDDDPNLVRALTTPEIGAALKGLAELPDAINNLAEAVRELKR